MFSALDNPESRKVIAAARFPYMIDVGVGHGPIDFETIQVHSIGSDDALVGLWEHAQVTDRSGLMAKPAYQEEDERIGGCGMEEIAGAGVAVPFVGAAAGAIAVAQGIRIFSLAEKCKSFQLQMACPEMPSAGEIGAGAQTGCGGERMRLGSI
jgi:hypothetical protein